MCKAVRYFCISWLFVRVAFIEALRSAGLDRKTGSGHFPKHSFLHKHQSHSAASFFFFFCSYCCSFVCDQTCGVLNALFALHITEVAKSWREQSCMSHVKRQVMCRAERMVCVWSVPLVQHKRGMKRE